MASSSDIDRALVRAGRALLNWSQRELAAHADIGLSTLADFERGGRQTTDDCVKAIFDALAKAGVNCMYSHNLLTVNMADVALDEHGTE